MTEPSRTFSAGTGAPPIAVRTGPGQFRIPVADAPLSAEVFRADDMFHARITFVAPPVRGSQARLVIGLGPQHVAETQASPFLLQRFGRLAGGSRLAFSLASAAPNPLGGDLGALLATAAAAPGRVASQADTPATPASLNAPATDETAIELPWRLILSPGHTTVWRHPTLARASAGRVPLWATRAAPGGSASGPITLRAIWTPDLLTTGTGVWQSPVDAQARRELVWLTAVQPQNGSASTIDCDALWLTALGGTLRAQGTFPIVTPGPAGLPSTSLVGWSQRTEQGRDSFVRVVLAGHLAPFGHRASVIEIWRRQIVKGEAVLVKTSFLVVNQRVVRFGAGDGRFPFVEAELPPGPFVIASVPDEAFPVTTPSGAALWIDVRLRDLAGRDHATKARVAFGKESAGADALANAYNGVVPKDRRLPLKGARVRLAPSSDGRDDSSVSLDDMVLTGSSVSSADGSPLAPAIALMTVEVPGSAELAGGRKTMPAAYADAYLAHGFGAANPGEVLLQRLDKDVNGVVLAAPVLFGSGDAGGTATIGGLLNPQMAIHGLSRATGAVTGAVDRAADALALAANPLSFDPATADFSMLPDFKILGVVGLKSLIKTVTKVSDALPRLQRLEDATEHRVEMGLSLDGHPTETIGPLIFLTKGSKVADPDGLGEPASPFTFSLLARTTISKQSPAVSASSVTASMTNFALRFLLGPGGSMQLNFARLGFVAEPGKKPDFLLDFAAQPLTLGGPLAFVQKILSLVPSSAFSDPPDLQISTSGVLATYSLGLPPLQFGAFALTNLTLVAGFSLPFLGDRPALRLALADRTNPFNILVACLGGGGFVAIEVDTKGLRVLELTLEAHAGVALNLGVASGAVLARVGIYFRLDLTSPDGAAHVTLEAFVEISGAVCVLGLITVSIVCGIALSYDGHKLLGIGTVSVGIKLLFVKKTVSFSIERKIAGSGGDPAFTDAFPLLSSPGAPILSPRFAAYTGAFDA